MRLVIIIIFMTIYFIISLPVQLILLIVGLFSKRARLMAANAIVRFGFNVIRVLAGVKVTVEGRENIPDNEAVLYAGNHNGFFDLIVGHPLCKPPTAIVAKAVFKKFPIFSWWMMLIECVFIDRQDVRSNVRSIKKATELIEKGISVLIYPEGTRSKDGNMLPFKEGSFKIAKKTGCAVIPVAMTGTAAIFDDHKPWVKAGPVTITFGEPVYPKDLTKEQLSEMGPVIQSRIASILDNKAQK